MVKDYTPPFYKGEGFDCPYCGVFAHQDWYEVFVENSKKNSVKRTSDKLSLSYCDKCGQFSVWIQEDIIYPIGTDISIPHKDMPEEVKIVYHEARNIMKASPRCAAALLRYGLRILMQRFREEGNNIDTALLDLRRKGLDVKIQKALDSLKVTGEETINPGQIDPRDDEETARILFNLLNLIVDLLITQPKRVDEILDSLPGKKGSKKKGDEFLFRAKITE